MPPIVASPSFSLASAAAANGRARSGLFAAGPSSHSPLTPAATTREELALAWATLDAFGVLGRASKVIDETGGPLAWMSKDPLDLWALRDDSRLRSEPGPALPIATDARRMEIRSRIAVARKKAATLRPFLAEGGEVIGGLATGRLLRAKSPPLCVYASGATELLRAIGPARAVAIVGTRHATDAGLARARRWAKVLACHGVVVVSGGALGIDSAAHEGALSCEGNTVAVLGDAIRINRTRVTTRPDRLEAMIDAKHSTARALTFTTGGPWAVTGRASFVSRNRLVAALVDAVVVVEASEGSGSLYTVKDANALEIPVYAVPGDPDIPQSSATNRLIKNMQATMATDPYDLLQALGVTARPSVEAKPIDVASLPPLLKALVEAGGRLSVDALAEIMAIDVATVLERGLTLELEGRLKRSAGTMVFVR